MGSESMIMLEETKYSLAIDTSLNRKKGYLVTELNWPKTEFENIKISGKYDFLSDVKSAEITVKNNNVVEKYSFDVKVNNNQFMIEITTPLEGFSKINLKGDYPKSYSKHSLLGSVQINDNINYKIDGMVHLKNKMFDINLESPIQGMKLTKVLGKIRDNKIDFEVQTEHEKYRF